MNSLMPAPLSVPVPSSGLTNPAEVIHATTEALHQFDLTTAREDQQIAIIASQIDLSNSAFVLRYGQPFQRQLANFVDSSLQHSLLALDRNTTISNDFLKRLNAKVQNFNKDISKSTLNHSKLGKLLKDHCRLLNQEIDRVTKELVGHRLNLSVYIRTLEQMYSQVLQLYQQFKLYLAAGQQKLSSVREHQLSQLKAGISDEPGSVLTYRELENQYDKFEQRLQDLQVSQTLCLQTAVQIQLAIAANQQLILNIQNTILNAFSIWKQSIANTITLKVTLRQQAISSSNTVLCSTLSGVRKSQEAQCTQAAITALVESTQSTS